MLEFERSQSIIHQEIAHRPFRLVYYRKRDDDLSSEEYEEVVSIKYSRAEELIHYDGCNITHKSGQVDRIDTIGIATINIPSGRYYHGSSLNYGREEYLYLTSLRELFYRHGAHRRLLRSDVLHLSYESHLKDLVVVTLDNKIYFTSNLCLSTPKWTEVPLQLDYEVQEIKLYRQECRYLMILGKDNKLRVYNLLSFTLEKEVSEVVKVFAYDNLLYNESCFGYIKRDKDEDGATMVHCGKEMYCDEVIVPFLDDIILLDVMSTPLHGFHPEQLSRANHDLDYVCLEFDDE